MPELTVSGIAVLCFAAGAGLAFRVFPPRVPTREGKIAGNLKRV